MARQPDQISYPPRGLSREDAARYVGVGATKFDQMVSDRLMPRPKKVAAASYGTAWRSTPPFPTCRKKAAIASTTYCQGGHSPISSRHERRP